MKIAIFTNTFLPHVGGVANSVATLVDGMRERGHDVLVFAPEFPDQPEKEQDVVRIPAIQNFNGTDFSFKLPSGTKIGDRIKAFKPDIIHCHHPFLLGDAGMRMAYQWDLPLVFTHHTKYEDYVHYVLEESDWLMNLAIELATEYANLCDAVIAPSDSLRKLIQKRGVEVPVSEIPTGIDYEKFSNGDGSKPRDELGIPDDAFLLGHVGRLAEEKNLSYLMQAAVHYLKDSQDAHFLVVGNGDLLEELKESAEENGLSDRVHFLGKLTKQNLVNAYHAMDLFLFSSKSETQGMVIAEAMAAGLPVVALDASGVRDILRDGQNGRMIDGKASPKEFASAIAELREAFDKDPDSFRKEIENTAREFSTGNCLDKVEQLYTRLIEEEQEARDMSGWDRFANRIEAEWDMAVGRARAVGAAFKKVTPE